MKFLAVFAVVVAVASAHNTWNLQQLSMAIEDPNTDPALLPYLETALNEMMETIFAGNNVEPVVVTIGGSPAAPTWTLQEVSAALQDPNTDPALIPALEEALNQMMADLWSGNPVAPVAIGASVSAPAMELHYYSLHDVGSLLQDPTTNPQLVPYLEHAMNTMMEALYSGVQMEHIVIAVPAGLEPIEASVPSDVIPAPIIAETPVSASPLVQIILNINQQ